MKLTDRFLLCGGWAICGLALLMNSCSFNPPPNTGAFDAGITETNQPRTKAFKPSSGPPPLPEPPRSRTGAMTNVAVKAMAAVDPNPDWPRNVRLTRITTTDKSGKRFTVELTLEGNQTIRANDKMAVILFALQTTNYLVEVCTNVADAKWTPFSSGVTQDTNGAIVVVDVHEGTRPVRFYRQKAQ